MATRPYKTTGCFRFALFLVLFAPIAYLGASYYNGQDGIQNIKNLVTKITGVFSQKKAVENTTVDGTTTESNNKLTTPTVTPYEVEELKSTIERKNKEINTLIDENLDLKLKLKECEVKSGTTKPAN